MTYTKRAACLIAMALLVGGASRRPDPFAIEVVDEATGRGVPLVELRTTSNVRFYTDSHGLVAVDDPSLMGQTVFFHARSHGYELTPDGFGMRGRRLDVRPGGTAQIKIKRINVAQRLYRITGEGIYHDSVLLGRAVPTKKPLLNGQVTGQDSAHAVVYRGKIHWFWGDTNRLSYALGQFGTSAATSELPATGGLDPSVGVDLSYLVDQEGFSRPVFQKEGDNPIWLDGVFVIKDKSGVERLVGKASVMKSLRETVARRLVVFDDKAGRFETIKDIPLDAPLYPQAHPFCAEVDGVEYIYCGNVFPNVRFRADWEGVCDLSRYEAYTCLAPGGRGDAPKFDRDANGKLIWGWKRDTAALGTPELLKLFDKNDLGPEGAWPSPRDVESKQPLVLALQSVHYNNFRKRFVGIGMQLGGKSSYLGEIWYSEADRPEGPWRWARKVVTHDHYSFYNPVQHPFFERDGGRVIYFEGTYVTTFSRKDEDATPRYDYNQIMYHLDLSDPRLALPADASDARSDLSDGPRP